MLSGSGDAVSSGMDGEQKDWSSVTTKQYPDDQYSSSSPLISVVQPAKVNRPHLVWVQNQTQCKKKNNNNKKNLGVADERNERKFRAIVGSFCVYF